MPGGNRSQLGNELFAQTLYLPAVTVPNVPASSTVTQSITIAGVIVGDMLQANWQSNVVGLAVENVYVTAPNTTTWVWSNATVAAINSTAAQPFLLEVTRPENASTGLNSLPNTVQ